MRPAPRFLWTPPTSWGRNGEFDKRGAILRAVRSFWSWLGTAAVLAVVGALLFDGAAPLFVAAAAVISLVVGAATAVTSAHR